MNYFVIIDPVDGTAAREHAAFGWNVILFENESQAIAYKNQYYRDRPDLVVVPKHINFNKE